MQHSRRDRTLNTPQQEPKQNAYLQFELHKVISSWQFIKIASVSRQLLIFTEVIKCPIKNFWTACHVTAKNLTSFQNIIHLTVWMVDSLNDFVSPDYSSYWTLPWATYSSEIYISVSYTLPLYQLYPSIPLVLFSA
jgi:hypothetical protein